MRVIIDTDPGIDDAIAILLALASPEIELVALTTVSGNVGLAATTANALRVLELAGHREIPVAAGCDRPLVRPARHATVHGPDGLGCSELPAPRSTAVAEHAVELIAREVTNGGPVTLIAVGPLTNVALLCALRPDVVGRLERLIVMGGSVARGNVRPNAEFNTWADPEAAQRVLTATVPTLWVGLDVTLRATLTPGEIDELRAGRPSARAAARMLDYYGERELVDGRPGTPMHDALAVAAAFDPSLLATRAHHVEIDCGPELSRGTMQAYDPVHSDAPENAELAVAVDRERFARLLVERLR